MVHTDRMRANVTEGRHGLVFSQAVLLALVASGMTRDAAYRIVQRDTRLACEERRPLRTVLEADAEVMLDAGALDGAFSLERVLRHVSRFTEAIEEVEG